jgi:hypothetical protein
VSRDEVLDDAIAAAWGSGFGWDALELHALFADGGGTQVASLVCDQCGNREIGSVRRIPFQGTEHLIAGRTEDVGVADLRMRRELFEHDAAADDSRHGRRPAALVLVEPVRSSGVVSAWCPTHGRFQAPVSMIMNAVTTAQSRGVSIVRVTATDHR